ncbi:MAG: purine-nucleoside phosphorylase [Crenarchaeota archaeon]|nr:purine-nucleoside phosphorylase [Thermoproteota archaeon]
MYRRPIHIKAEPGKVAEKVIVVGDPDRTTFIASFLKNAEKVNTHRGFLVYTGEHEGTKISVACHGVGAPSAAIVFEELVMLGARTMIRLGTTGALIPDLHRGDIVIPSGAAYFQTSPILQLTENVIVPAVPDIELTYDLYRYVRERSKRNVVLGNVISNDMFYMESPDLAKKLSRLGIISIEMECATLFTISRLRNIRSCALLLVSNSLVNPEESEIPHSGVINEYYSEIIPVVLDFLAKT